MRAVREQLTGNPGRPERAGAAALAACLVLLWLLIAAPPAHAQAAGTLRYGGDADFRPFEYLDAQDKPQGFQIELLNEIARETGLRVDVRLGAWKQIEADFRAGSLDAIAMTVADTATPWATFSPPHAAPMLAVYYRTGTAPPQSLADLVGRTVAIEDSPPMLEMRDRFFGSPDAHVVVTDSVAAALKAVQERRADVALLSRASGDSAIAALGASDLAVSKFNLRLQSYAFATAPHDTALRERLNAALERLEASGRLRALRTKWLDAPAQIDARRSLEVTIGRQRVSLVAIVLASGAAIGVLLLLLRKRQLRLRVERARRREAERALQVAEQRLLRSFTAHPDAMIITERSSNAVVDVNDAGCRLIGLQREALIGPPIDVHAGIKAADGLAALQRRFGEDGGVHSAPVRFDAADDTTRSCLVWSEPLQLDDTPCVFSIVRDVTAELQANEQLREDYDAALAQVRTTEADLAATRAKLAQADAEVVSFTGFIAHDLKAPLRAVRGFTGLLRRDLAAGRINEAKLHADQIEGAARRMDRLVDALTRLARAGHAPTQRQTLDMHRLAVRAWQLVVLADPGRNVPMALSPLPSAVGDEALITQVWQNLLDNAWKFTSRVTRPEVDVDTFQEGGRTWYRVSDNGAGFEMDHAQNLFQPFQRMHANAEFAGTGIGLTLVRRVVAAHGGEVRLTSKVGFGTVVEFCLAPATEGQLTGTAGPAASRRAG